MVIHYVPADAENLEERLKHVATHLNGDKFSNLHRAERASIRRFVSHILISGGKLFCRVGKNVFVVVSALDGEKVLYLLQNSMGNWNLNATKKFGTDPNCWHTGYKHVVTQVKPFDTCQRCQPLPRYCSKLQYLIVGLFQLILIDFARTFPKAKGGFQYVLVVAKHLTNEQ